MSRATWYRQNKAGKRRETTLSASIFLSNEDRTVSPEREVEFKRGFASKKARGLPSSQTATTMVADVPISRVPHCCFGLRPMPMARAA
jgi:hypothetical protein